MGDPNPPKSQRRQHLVPSQFENLQDAMRLHAPPPRWTTRPEAGWQSRGTAGVGIARGGRTVRPKSQPVMLTHCVGR
jgi:hypothetical protein